MQPGENAAREAPARDDPVAAAERLEAALERIARVARDRAAGQAHASDAAQTPVNTAEIAARLDSLIADLRQALDEVA
ncbi:MAG: hypothetical protein JOY71_17220 [Acetobacteraceae bacterium]|nr:hypothetical protein [Acetobacteraceae bacterium]MBV8523835.1 hypothetical protein [Acetobacteraceae bacterium]